MANRGAGRRLRRHLRNPAPPVPDGQAEIMSPPGDLVGRHVPLEPVLCLGLGVRDARQSGSGVLSVREGVAAARGYGRQVRDVVVQVVYDR